MLRQSVRKLSNLFLHQSCPLCDRPTPRELCDSCWQQVQQCALPPNASPTSDALKVLTWGQYRDSLKHAIAALKYHNNPQLAFPLGTALGIQWQQSPIATRRPPLVIPIPMHPKKQQERGFNQTELLAKNFCQQTGLPMNVTGLTRRVATVPQFGLGIQERQKNLTGAFALSKSFRENPPKQPVLLLDDIYTTGTTVKVAANELRRHRISVCGVAVVARALLSSASKKDEDECY